MSSPLTHRLAAHGSDGLGDLIGRPGVGAGAIGIGAKVVDDELGTMLGEHQGVLPTDAAAGTGDHRHATFIEFAHQPSGTGVPIMYRCDERGARRGGIEISERNQRIALLVNKGIGFLSDAEMVSYFSPKVVWQIGHTVLEGHEGVLSIHHVAQLAYPDGAERPVRSVLADDTRVMVQHVNRARTNKGVDYDNEYVKIFEFDTEGKIAAVWEYMDSLYASTAFNVLEIGGSAPVNTSAPLPLSVDEVLTTTRAVRHRLDFDRPVSRELSRIACAWPFKPPTAATCRIGAGPRRRPGDPRRARQHLSARFAGSHRP